MEFMMMLIVGFLFGIIAGLKDGYNRGYLDGLLLKNKSKWWKFWEGKK